MGVVERLLSRGRRAYTVRNGPAAGLRLYPAGASAEYAGGGNELPVQSAIDELLSPGDVFYDVGANVGFFALLAARKVGPDGAAYAFEAVAELAEAIGRNAALNDLGNVTVIASAVSDTDGSAELLLTTHPGGATLAGGQTPPDLRGRRRVDTVRLDTLVAQGRIRPPRVVKIDVEGAEPAVLAGMTQLLAAHRPALVCEFDGPDDAAVEAATDRFEAALSGLAYDVRTLDPSYEGSGWQVRHVVAVHR
ncbi:FkbM family methyltransferase [Jiangella anatolica]|uniref:Methyltransferase n=1 Tax=Jiangella anatolica TaxID=2670374 RepID=A0A2W2BUU5_9ACTN|nr:FkbM family methyltransferase [Jiangella anatolica]PZF79909.1 methyltransferase [Jiangella anatolica]